MPALTVTRDTAWDYWSRGLIAAANIGLDFESFSSSDLEDQNGYWRKVMANLTLKRNYNAFRLWFGWADRFSIQENDIVTVALQGWDSTAATSGGNTVKGVAAHITTILDTAKSLGAGIFLVTNFHQAPDGLLWSDSTVQDPATGATYSYRDILKMFWVKTLTAWQDHPALIGFDLLNEPAPPWESPIVDPATNVVIYDAKLATHRAAPNGWPQTAQKLITGIRAQEASLNTTRNSAGKASLTPMPLIVEGIYVGSADGLMVFGAPAPGHSTGPYLTDGSTPRIVYSFHSYDPGSFCGQGVGEWGYEDIGTAYPLPGVAFEGGWYDGTPHADLYTHTTADDVKAVVQRAIDFKQTYNVPVFVGEFSAAQPSIAQVAPPDPNRAQNTPSVRVSEVQNTVLWQAPWLARLAAVSSQDPDPAVASAASQTQVNAVLDAMAAAGLQRTQAYTEFFAMTKRRWITELEVSADGSTITVTMGHTAPPGPKDNWDWGFRVSTSPLSKAEIIAYAQSVGESALPFTDAPNVSSKFYTTPNARIEGKYTDASNTINMVAAALDMATLQAVKVVRHTCTIEFAAPAGAPKGLKLTGAKVLLPTDPNDPSKTASVQMPVALLWLESQHSGADIDASRLAWAQDALYTWQQQGFSWAWHAEDSGGPTAVVMWRPSKAIGELISIAASGRHIAKRTN